MQTHCIVQHYFEEGFSATPPLLIMQRFPASLFDALIAANTLNTTLSRQDSVNVVERLHTHCPAFFCWMDVV